MGLTQKNPELIQKRLAPNEDIIDKINLIRDEIYHKDDSTPKNVLDSISKHLVLAANQCITDNAQHGKVHEKWVTAHLEKIVVR